MTRDFSLCKAVCAVFCLSLTISCGKTNKQPQDADSEVMTNLGTTANNLVASRFASYKAKTTPHCRSTSAEAKRVIVTGFGLFSGVNYNISGTVAGSLLNGYFPGAFDAALPAGTASPDSSVLATADYGGRAQVKQVTIEGNTYEVCTLLLEVTWDLAASIIVHEASQFKPELIVMSGADGSNNYVGTFEARTRNEASIGAGSYDSRGQSRGDIAPISGSVLADYAGTTVDMTWNRDALAAATSSLVSEIDLVDGSDTRYSLDTDLSDPGSYICNNVSYVVLSAIAGRTIRLAGRRISNSTLGYAPGVLANVKAGFFHYPWDATTGASPDSKRIYGWSKVIAKAIVTSVP